MILPGVSGSFLLVMMGMYSEVLGAVNDRDVAVLGAFALGMRGRSGAVLVAMPSPRSSSPERELNRA
jgi:uncharacterized membrane protein